MEHLRLVWQTGEALLESVAFEVDPEGTRYNILLATQEMLTNVLRHAYSKDESQPIEVSFVVEPAGFSVELRDCGPAFDPLAHDTAGVEEETGMPMSEGGFGIHIAKHVMDELGYERDQHWNVLRMTKYVGAPAHASSEGQQDEA